ncbi:ATP-binding cassette domain-containing protein [Candidatus Dependentiae bacterium]|nr:ATP-binding cassette domain-containing protein [Candidatus Dependentiae bacterium]
MKINKLICKELFKSFLQGNKKLKVLNGINYEFEKGKSYAIIGASGSGKSTLMHLLGGLDNPDSGSVFFDKNNIFGFSQKEKEKFLNVHLGFVFQFHYLIKELTVLQNIILPGLIAGEEKKDCIQKAEKLLKKVGLESKKDSYPTELSGGQLQRVSILRAIFNKPSFLLADEPTGDLDANNAQMITDLLLSCQEEWDMGLIICSHDKAVYEQMDKIITLKNGILE